MMVGRAHPLRLIGWTVAFMAGGRALGHIYHQLLAVAAAVS